MEAITKKPNKMSRKKTLGGRQSINVSTQGERKSEALKKLIGDFIHDREEMKNAFGTVYSYLNLKNMVNLCCVNRYFKREIVHTKFNERVRCVFYWQDMDNIIIFKTLELFKNVTMLEFRRAKHKLSTQDVRKAISVMEQKLVKIKFFDQSQLDFANLFSPVVLKYNENDEMEMQQVAKSYDSALRPYSHQIDLSALTTFEIVGYDSNMLNEYSITIILNHAPILLELNLTNISVFQKDQNFCINTLKTIFGIKTIQAGLKKLILLENPMLTNQCLFSPETDSLLSLRSLEHFEVGGCQDQYLQGITFENGLQYFFGVNRDTNNYSSDEDDSSDSESNSQPDDGLPKRQKTKRQTQKFKQKLKVLRFEYCSNVGDLEINHGLKYFADSLAQLTIRRNFYEESSVISDKAFDLNHQFSEDDDQMEEEKFSSSKPKDSYAKLKQQSKNTKGHREEEKHADEDDHDHGHSHDHPKPKKKKRDVPLTVLPNLVELRLIYTRNLSLNLSYLVATHFPNLQRLQLTSAPIGLCDAKYFGAAHLAGVIELDFSGDSYLCKETLNQISLNTPNLQIFHLGHFEHSDYSCQKTIMNMNGQQPLRGKYICEILKEKETRFQKLSKLFLEFSCDLTPYIMHEVKVQGIRKYTLMIAFDNNQRNVEQKLDSRNHGAPGLMGAIAKDKIRGGGDVGFQYQERGFSDNDSDESLEEFLF